MTRVISHLVPLLAAALLVVGVEPSSPPAVPPPPATNTLQGTLQGCPSKCGEVEIPYPFGIGAGCALEPAFMVTCDHSFKPPRPYINGPGELEGDFSSVLPSRGKLISEIISISNGEVRIFAIHSSICYSSDGTIESYHGVVGVFDPFLISSTRNVFTAIGCNIPLAFLENDSFYLSGCFTYCASIEEAAQDNEECTGLGCCHASLPANLTEIQISFGQGDNATNNSLYSNSCGYAFLAEKNWYNFSRRDLDGTTFANRVAEGRTIPLVLDWAIRSKGSCWRTPEGSTASACVSANSTCVDVPLAQGGGYRCNCSEGYQGNPYLSGGCTDIDECALRRQFPEEYEKKYPCGTATKCRNIPGNYTCQCKIGHVPATKGGCRPIFPGYATAILVTIVAIFVLALLVYFLRKEHQHRVRKEFFDKNGGEILKRMDIKTFTESELEKMTNCYSKLIGEGHFSKVFDGITTENQQVAVKCPKLDGSKKNPTNSGGEFVDEIAFQFKISHNNLVRLIGCCLETSVPRLVFEYISKGSLYSVLHDASKSCSLSLAERLDIAIGAAEAISYMHSHGDHKHVHGDIKSANILLGEELSPKVSDFGSSRLLEIDMYARAVAADRNYVDPVYMKTDRFTAKSDVYSFGVVLLELITRKTAKYNGNNSLPIDFIRCCKEEGNGRRMYDTDILVNDGDAQSPHVYIECLDKIGELAVRCLNEVYVDERPTMEEVVEELKQIKSIMVTEAPRSDETA